MDQSEQNLRAYLAHRGELIEYASSIVGDRAQGEDVVQEAFIRLRVGAADRVIEEPIGYLRRIIRNLAIDWTRRSGRERRRLDSEADYETIAEDRPTQERIISDRDDLRVVMEALAELPPRTRIALEMHRLDGRKLKDIAAHFGISVARAHSLVYEGLEHCRARLSRRT